MWREYIINEDINILNITTNIYLNNILTNKNYLEVNKLFYCFNNFSDLKYCNYNFINSEKLNMDINYNKKLALLLIIWKNKKFVDKTINFNKFLNNFNINAFFNLFDFIKLKNGQVKLLGEELFIGNNKNISLVNNFTNDITKFNLYNQKNKYENFYYKQIN